MIPPRHIPALCVATYETFGLLLPLFDAPAAVFHVGLPAHVAYSQPAQSVITIYGSRATTQGLLLFGLYAKGMYDAIDIALMTLAYAGVVEGLVCWKEGNGGKGLWRGVCALFYGTLGLMGMTQGTSLAEHC